MIDPQQQHPPARPLISITPRKKSVRFTVTSTSPRVPASSTLPIPTTNPSIHHRKPLNVSYSIPTSTAPASTINIDHITNESHMQQLFPSANSRRQYVPTSRNNLQIVGEKLPGSMPTEPLVELQQFMRAKAEDLRRNMTQITSTFYDASVHLHQLKEERQQTVTKRKSRIPVSTRLRSPSPPVVIYKRQTHRSLTDLRWYCLARKFSVLWQQRVFGCYLRRIKTYRDQTLMRRCLTTWWTAVQYPRMQAEQHANRKLLECYFNIWKSFSDDEQDIEIIHFANRRLLKRCFLIWHDYVLIERRQKNERNQIAIEHAVRQRIRNAWHLWKHQMDKRRTRQNQLIVANEQYQRALAFRFYHLWQTNTVHRRQELEKRLRADYHHRLHLHRICFNAWLTYAEYRRRKTAHKQRVHGYYQHRLLNRFYSNWKEALTRQLLIEQHQHRLAELQQRILIRWAFEQWKQYLIELIDERRTIRMAEQYSERRVMRTALIKLRQYVVVRRLKQRHNWIAVRHRARMLERFYYRAWKHRFEQREDLLMYAEIHKADSFYAMKTTIRYWFYWRRYVNDCRQENSRIHAARKYYESKLVRKYFHLLRNNITDERHEQLLEKRADEYYRMRYLRLYYTHWIEQTRIHERFRMNWRIAIVHQEKIMCHRFFANWLHRAHLRLIDNQHQIVAERHYFRTCLVQAWSAWRHLIDERHNEERSERIAIQFYYHTIERRTLNAWIMYIRHCRYMKQLYRESEQFHFQHRGKCLFLKWLTKARHRHHLMSTVNERFIRAQRNILRQLFRQWRENVQDERDERGLTEFAVDHYNRLLKRKVLLAWHHEMTQQVVMETENEMKCDEFKQRKNAILLRTVYTYWKQLSDECLRDRHLLRRAQAYYERRLLAKSFVQWREQFSVDMRLKLLERQAIWFDRMRLLSRIYVVWKQAWHNEQRLVEQKRRALLYWALQLQKKCLVQWLVYTSERRRKKIRYTEATRRRHEELLRDSLRKFLVYTDHTKQRRQATFIHQQVYLYHDRNALAWKYACKWRAFAQEAAGRKRQKQQLTKPVTVVPVTKNPLALVRFDNSPPKIVNRPRPRKPDFLSDSFSTATASRTKSETKTMVIRSPPSTPPPAIDHSLHSPFVSVKQPSIMPTNSSLSPPPLPLLLPPSAFQIHRDEFSMPSSSRTTIDDHRPAKIHRRPYSAQSTTLFADKDNLLNVKQRLEIYLSNKAKLKHLRQQLVHRSSSQHDAQLEHECQQLSAHIASEKVQLTNILHNL